MKWHKRFISIAELIATWSKDPSSQVGSIIVKDRIILSTGYNGFPRGIADNGRLKSFGKNKLMIHAEKNAIYNCNSSLVGATMYSTHSPCCDCALAIIQVRVEVVVVRKNYGLCGNSDFSIKWKESLKDSEMLFKEAGIQIIYVS